MRRDFHYRSDFVPKTIFGTTEKSNFILNMKPETLQKWTAAMLMLCVLIPQIGNLFITGMNSPSSFLGSFLYLTGFGSILFFIIAMLRKEHTFKENKIYWAIIFMAVWAFASYYSVFFANNMDGNSETVRTALEGELGRYEGLLSLIAYFGIFLLATTVSSERSVKILMDVIIGAGIIQAVIAVLQHIPNLDFLTKYDDLPTIALRDVMLSSGLSDSPIFFGSFLTLVSGIAIVGAVYEKNIIRARVYGIAALLFLLTGLFTSSIVPLIGIGSAFVIAAVIILIKNSKDKTEFSDGILKTPLKRYAVLAGAMVITFVIVLLVQGIYIRDKAIAYYDAYFRLFIVYSYSPVDKRSLYEIAWGRSLDFIKENPIFGVGPDCLAKAQNISEELQINAIDKSYNEYLYIAATRGIPSLAAYLVFIVYVLKRSFGGLKSFLGDTEKWYRPALLAAVAAYMIQGFFSASSVTVAPVFWLAAGIVCAKKLDKPDSKNS